MRRFGRASLLSIALIVGLAGCGDDEDALPPPAPVSSDPGATVRLPGIDPTTSSSSSTTTRARGPSVLDELGARQTGEGVQVDLAGDVLFDFNKADLRPEAGPIFDKVKEASDRFPLARIRLVGHTDNVGDDAYNLDLSNRRAKAVADGLIARSASLSSRIEVQGKGETEPVAPNDTDANRQKNRRVAILFVGARL